jgi:hypothetical protein
MIADITIHGLIIECEYEIDGEDIPADRDEPGESRCIELHSAKVGDQVLTGISFWEDLLLNEMDEMLQRGEL